MAAFGDGTSGSGSASVGGNQVIAPTSIPELRQLFDLAQGNIPQRNEMASLQDMIMGGMNSPLLELVLGPALQRLQAPQAQQRQNLTETTRAAGGLRGSTYGADMNTLQNNQALQTNDLMAQVIQQMLVPLITGQLTEQRQQFLPAESMTNLLNAARPQIARGNTSSVSGWDNIPASMGLATPMQSDSMASTAPSLTDYLRRLSGSGGNTPAPTAPMATPPPASAPPQYFPPLSGGGSPPAPQPTSFTPGQGGPQYGDWQPMIQVPNGEGWW